MCEGVGDWLTSCLQRVRVELIGEVESPTSGKAHVIASKTDDDAIV